MRGYLVNRGPRILFFDLETAGVNALKADLGFVACFGYKWSTQKQTKCLTIDEESLRHFDDSNLLGEASLLIEEADLLCAHFGSVFDRRFFQGRLLINKLPPVPPTKIRDPVFIARSVANFSSNRLGHLSEILQLDQKKYTKKGGTEWPGWWFKVMQGDQKALRAMAKYCKQDVRTLEALYYRLLPFDNAHPRVYSDRTKCPACGGPVQYRGFAVALDYKYRRYQCSSCGRWGRERNALKD